MKIAFISYHYPPDTGGGGIATYVEQAAKMLQNRGNLVEVFTASHYRAGVEIEASGVRIHRIQLENKKLFANEIAPVFAERHALVQFDVLERPDFCADAAGVIRLIPEIPLVVKLHTPNGIFRQVQCPDAKFRFVGKAGLSPDREKNMQQYIEKLLHPYCHSLEFIGPVPNSQIPFILGQTDVCIFPSLFDSFGLVCLEAMAAGRAVIGSIASGMVEIINTNSVGRLISPNSPQQITQSTIELLQNPELRVQLGIAARERILQEYNLERIGDLQEKSYQVAIQTKQRLGTRRKFPNFCLASR